MAEENVVAPGAEQPPEGTPPAGEEQTTGRPENIPEKFWDAEAGAVRVDEMAKSYGELSTKLGTLAISQPGAGLTIPDTPVPDTLDDNAGINQMLQSVGLDPYKIGETWQKEGELTQKQYSALKKANPMFTKGVVDDFMDKQGQVAKQQMQSMRASAVTQAGGEDQLNNLIQWGAENFSAEEKKQFNDSLQNPATAPMAVSWLISKHKDAVGASKSGNLLEGDTSGGAAPGAFTSQREVATAMGDPRYNADTDYTAKVNRKLMASPNPDRLPA